MPPPGRTVSRRTAAGWAPRVRGERSGRASRRTAAGWAPRVRGERSKIARPKPALEAEHRAARAQQWQLASSLRQGTGRRHRSVEGGAVIVLATPQPGTRRAERTSRTGPRGGRGSRAGDASRGEPRSERPDALERGGDARARERAF